jgi:hypothetical protein
VQKSVPRKAFADLERGAAVERYSFRQLQGLTGGIHAVLELAVLFEMGGGNDRRHEAAPSESTRPQALGRVSVFLAALQDLDLSSNTLWKLITRLGQSRLARHLVRASGASTAASVAEIVSESTR